MDALAAAVGIFSVGKLDWPNIEAVGLFREIREIPGVWTLIVSLIEWILSLPLQAQLVFFPLLCLLFC